MIEIIAEIAQGFEGSQRQAELLAKGAVAADADSVKFQLIYADELATPDYQYHGLFKSLEMEDAVWSRIAEEIRQKHKKLYFDVFGDRSLALAKKLKADGIKLSSTEFYNDHLIKKAVEAFERVLISVGGIPVEDIDSLVKTLPACPQSICLMAGFQSEPTPLDQNNLKKLRALRERYPLFKVGFMDHSAGDQEDALFLPVMTLGFEIDCLEKHLTLDRLLKIEDYVSGLEPERFREFVRLIRKFEKALGRSSLELTETEIAYRKKAGKVAIANRPLKAGVVLRNEDVALKRVGRPPAGTEIKKLDQVIGRKLRKDLPADTAIVMEDLCEN